MNTTKGLSLSAMIMLADADTKAYQNLINATETYHRINIILNQYKEDHIKKQMLTEEVKIQKEEIKFLRIAVSVLVTLSLVSIMFKFI